MDRKTIIIAIILGIGIGVAYAYFSLQREIPFSKKVLNLKNQYSEEISSIQENTWVEFEGYLVNLLNNEGVAVFLQEVDVKTFKKLLDDDVSAEKNIGALFFDIEAGKIWYYFPANPERGEMLTIIVGLK